jgi:hypothetical protein
LSQENFVILEKDLSVYQKKLSDHDITDKSLLLSNYKPALAPFWLVYFLAPFAFLGKLIWWLPGRLSIWIANKTVTRIDFYTSVLSGVLGVLGLIWWGLLIGMSYSCIGNLAFPLSLVWPLLCYIYMQWEERKTDFIALLHARKMMKKLPAQIVELIQLRNRIMG